MFTGTGNNSVILDYYDLLVDCRTSGRDVYEIVGAMRNAATHSCNIKVLLMANDDGCEFMGSRQHTHATYASLKRNSLVFRWDQNARTVQGKTSTGKDIQNTLVIKTKELQLSPNGRWFSVSFSLTHTISLLATRIDLYKQS